MATDPSMAILVVDDFSTMVRIVRNLLKQLGFDNVDEAAGGSSALAKMREKPYDLVISDWNMEPMSGDDLLREIRAHPVFQQTRFIMVTAESNSQNVIAARDAGADNYILKPFTRETLQQKIQSVFSQTALV